MNLATILGLKLGQNITLVGKPEVTSIMSVEKNEPYYVCKLANPITVRCSTSKNIEAFETDEVYVRESDINSDGWSFVDEKKPEDGFFMKDWVVDFSVNQEIAIYQSETIEKYLRGTRDNKRQTRDSRINTSLREKLKNKK